MAPKAKQQAEAKAQPKAKAEAKADSQQPKAKAKAEAKAASAPAAPKAEAKAEAKAKAKAEAKGKAEPAPQAAAAKSAGQDPKAKAKAKEGAKSQGAAPAKAESQQPKAKAKGEAKADRNSTQSSQSAPGAPQSKSKAKGKAKAEPAPPPPEPEPVEEEPMEEVKKKKKTNHRGGRNKNKEETGPWPEDQPISPAAAAPKFKPSKSATDVANAAAEKDPDLKGIRERFRGIDGAGDARTRKAELEKLIKEIDEELHAKKVTSKVRVSSTQLEQNLHEIDQTTDMSPGDRDYMKTMVKKEIDDARQQEIKLALRTRYSTLKVQVEEKLNNLVQATMSVPPKEKPAPKGSEPPVKDTAPKVDENAGREAKQLSRLGNLHKKDANGAKLESKTIELDTNITKYLFTPPYILNGRFEQQFKVLVDTVRAAKGSGKGGKGSTPPGKELTITGLSMDDVNQCEKALKSLDFSGMRSRDIDNGLVMPTNNKKADLEKEFNVFIFKNQSQLSVFGSTKNVNAAFEKIEDEGFCKVVSVSADLVKMIYDKKLQETWRANGTLIKIDQPPAVDGKGSQPAKITVQGKSRAETEENAAKVEEFKNNTGSEVVRADSGVVGKLFERANASILAKRFREIQDASGDFLMRKTPEGIMLMGPKSKLKKVQAELKDLLQKASFDPVKVPVNSDQMRIFTKEKCDQIRDNSSLMEMYKSNENMDGERMDVLVLVGDETSVGKAKSAIEEVITNEGACEEVKLSDAACKELLVNKGSKIQEIQSKFSTYIQVQRKTGSAKIYGSQAGVESTKKLIAAFAKKADSIITKTLTLEQDQIGRVIGTKGSTLNGIRKECNVEIKIDNNNPIVEMKGELKAIQQAEHMIKEVLGQVPPEPKAKAKPAASPKPAAETSDAPARTAPAPRNSKAKTSEGYTGNQTEDFPTLGGVAETKAKPTAKAWGKNNQAEDSAKEESPAEAYPELGGAKPKADAAAPAAAEAEEEEEEEEAGDCDDPFAMMGGMGEEQVYKVTLMQEAPQDDEA